MKRPLILAVALLLCGCAIGTVKRVRYEESRVVETVEVRGVAFGRSAVKTCEHVYRPGEAATKGTKPDRVCSEVTGGFLSSGIAGVLEAAVIAISAYFAGS